VSIVLGSLLSRGEVETILESPIRWRVEWCAGAGWEPTEGVGAPLPPDVVSHVPSRSRLRKIERGIYDEKTWMFAYFDGDIDDPVLVFHEGP